VQIQTDAQGILDAHGYITFHLRGPQSIRVS
jgi:hypothetical protein